MKFPRQKYWNGFPFSSLGDLPEHGIEPALAERFFATVPPGNLHLCLLVLNKNIQKNIFISIWRKSLFKLGVTKRFLMVIHNVKTSRYYIFSNNLDQNSWSGESVGWREYFKGPWLADSCFLCILIKENCILTFTVTFWLCESGFWPGLLTKLEDRSVEGSTNGILKRGCVRMWEDARISESKNFFSEYMFSRGSKGKESRIWFLSFNLFLLDVI